MPYTMLIPIHNEANTLSTLLDRIEPYADDNEILVVDDGSTDGSYALLKKCSFLRLLRLDQNSGKGVAICKGLAKATNNKIVISDGDMELDPREIKNLMILDKENGIHCVFGSRYKIITPFASLWNFGNFFFTGLFNIVHGSNHSDALCCAKAFYKSDLNLDSLSAHGFDIDVELAGFLTKNLSEIHTVYLSYKRRSKKEGKKLSFKDSWHILKRILKS